MSDDSSFDDIEYEDGVPHRVIDLCAERYADEDYDDSEFDSDYEDVRSDEEDPYEYNSQYESSEESM